MWKKGPSLSQTEYRDFKHTYKKKVRFLIDENLGKDAADLIVSLGYNTVFVGDVGLSGHSDEAVFAYAWKHKRIILTHDRDYLDDKKFPIHRNPGVIIMPGANGDGALEVAIASVLSLIAPYSKAHIQMKIEISPDRTWTIRRRDGVTKIKLAKGGEYFIWEE